MFKLEVTCKDEAEKNEIFTDSLSECESDWDCNQMESECESSDSEIITVKRSSRISMDCSDSDSDDGRLTSVPASSCLENDFQPKLEPFEGEPGLKTMPNDPRSIEELLSFFIDDKFVSLLVEETNRYYLQNGSKYKELVRWKDVTVMEMKKFLGLIVLMGQVQKDVIYDYWSTLPTIETPFFSKTMSRNRFVQIWQMWYFPDNKKMMKSSDRLAKVAPILEYFRDRFNNVYVPTQRLTLSESIIPWRGRLAFRTHNPAKLIRCGLLVRMVCEASTGYIYNVDVHSGTTSKLEDTVLSVLRPCLDMGYHVFMDNCCNGVDVAERLLERKTRICGVIRSTRDVPKNLRNVKLQKGQVAFWRQNEVLLQTYRDKIKRNVHVITTIHSAREIETGKFDRKTGRQMTKLLSVEEYDKCTKGCERAERYLSYYTIFKGTVKWTKRFLIFMINCALFNAFQIYVSLNGKGRSYKNFLHEVAITWLNNNVVDVSASDAENAGPSGMPTRRTPKFDPPGRLSMDITKHKLGEIVSKSGKRAQRQCKVCSARKKRSRTWFFCIFCNVPLHKGTCYEKYHSYEKY